MSFVPYFFGNYTVINRLAKGGMGDVLLARASQDNRPSPALFAIKCIREDMVENSDAMVRFDREVAIMRELHHPNIVHISDFGEIDGHKFMALEFDPGKDVRWLDTKLNSEPDWQKWLPLIGAFLVREVCQALTYTHSHHDKVTGESASIVHKDISPQNILVSYRGKVRLLDFGIAHCENQTRLTKFGSVNGKPSYFSPEQILSEPLDGRSDLFSLGIVLWEILAGRPLFKGDDAQTTMAKVLEMPIPPPSTFNPFVSPALDAITAIALERQKCRRYLLAEDFSADLSKCLAFDGRLFGAGDLCSVMQTLFEKEIYQESSDLLQQLKIVPKNLQLENALIQSPYESLLDMSRFVNQELLKNSKQINEKKEADAEKLVDGYLTQQGKLEAAQSENSAFEAKRRTAANFFITTLVGSLLIILCFLAGAPHLLKLLAKFDKNTLMGTAVLHDSGHEPRAVASSVTEVLLESPPLESSPTEMPRLESGGVLEVTTLSAVEVFMRSESGWESLGSTPLSKSLKPGVYQLLLRNQLLGFEREIEVTVLESRVTRLSPSLE